MLTDLLGTYKLDRQTIDRVVTRVSPGAYALGRLSEHTFYISYVGRSDDDLASRLKQHVGEYPEFQYGYCATAKEAFEKECRLYHDFTPPGNKVHPAKPSGTDYRCPVITCPY